MTDIPKDRKPLFQHKSDNVYDERVSEYRPHFILPIHDNNTPYPNSQLGTHRQIVVYWDDTLNGLSFLYPCGDMKMFAFDEEHSFDDFIESVITLHDEAKERSEAGALSRRTKAVEQELAEAKTILTQAEEQLDVYKARIIRNNAAMDTAEDTLSTVAATFENLERTLEQLNNPTPAEEPQEVNADTD